MTIIEVDCYLILDAFKNKEDYFISGEPIYKEGIVEIHEGPKPYYYFKGVAVYGADESVYSYNITSGVDLSEDRTAQYMQIDILRPIIRSIQSSEDEEFIRKVILSPLDTDRIRGYSSQHNTSDQFVSVCTQAMSANKTIPESARLVVKDIDEKKGDWPDIHLTDVQLKMLEKAKAFLLKIGIDIDNYPLRIVNGLGDGTMGRALDDVIYLSDIPFQLGTKQVASTLMEEWVHIKYGCDDFDRKMQTWLFDKILSIGEEINGEPL